MKNILFTFISLLPLTISSLEYEIQFESDDIRVSKWKLMPGEVVELHRDEYPHMVFPLAGGIVRRLEADGSIVDVPLPTGQITVRPVDPIGELHRSVNISDTAIEAFSIEIKAKI